MGTQTGCREGLLMHTLSNNSYPGELFAKSDRSVPLSCRRGEMEHDAPLCGGVGT